MPHAAVSERQKSRAKTLRRTMTRAETLLWHYLKAHHLDGLGVRRQVPMNGYVADFVCHAARLVIELDGETHDFESRQQHDRRRDAWFESQGYRVLRLTNEQVLTNLEGVLSGICEIAASRKSATPPSLSLPHKGGGNAQTAAASGATPSPPLPRKRGREQGSTSGTNIR